MTEEELLAYQGLKKQGVVLIKSSNEKYLVVVSPKFPNLTVTIPFRISVTNREYLNRERYIPEYYKGPNIQAQQIQYYQQQIISDMLADIIIY